MTSNPCLSEPLALQAAILPPQAGIPGQGSYQVHWYWNNTGLFSGTNPGAYLGAGANITLQTFPDCPVFWLRCVVTSADNVSVSRVQKIVVGGPACCTATPEGEGGDRSVSPWPGTRGIFPNPIANGVIHVRLEGPVQAPVPFSVIDLWGRTVLMDSAFPDRNGTLDIRADGLIPGLYILKTSSLPGQSNNFKFIVP